jgi:hypothetical protein
MSFESSQLSRWLSMSEVKAKRSVEKETVEKAKAGVCLICGQKATGRRGLCNGHYLKFARAKNELPKSKRIAFEESHIREGRILACGQVREIRDPNPFSEAS